MIINLKPLKELAEIDFYDIVRDVIIQDINEMRIILEDESFIEVWFSLKLKNRYSYHWERRHIDNTIYRHDNAPHKKWEHISTFPRHFHNGQEQQVEDSIFSPEPELGLKGFLLFARQKINSISSG